MKLKPLYGTGSILLLTGLMLLMACRRDPVVPDTPVISFATDVQPIIAGNCTAVSCHGTLSTEEFPLISYDDVVGNAHVIAGDPRSSALYEVITARQGAEIMPPGDGSRLSDHQVLVIYVWILQGAKNN